jgi:serine protease Do
MTFFGMALLIILLFTAYFTGRYFSSGTAKGGLPVLPTKNEIVNGKPLQTTSAVKTENLDKKTLNDEFIQKALKATVSVHTSWGIGSGFFIGEHEVVTNKHVIIFDQAVLDALKARIESTRKAIEVKIANINEGKKILAQMSEGPERSDLEIIIHDKEANLKRDMYNKKKDEELLSKLEDQKAYPNIRIIMDEKEYRVDNVITSSTHDLALLKVSSVSGQGLKRNEKEQPLQQGQVVYAIGSPMGLNNTVTSGIFSAYRKVENSDEQYLQIDAAINPGNSGGPLIDKNGYVLGVNTMILANTEGIGFAIPINTVFKDFSDSL